MATAEKGWDTWWRWWMFICAGITSCACFLFFSPAEELSFGSVETERKSLIILSNVAKNQVAFKVSMPASQLNYVSFRVIKHRNDASLLLLWKRDGGVMVACSCLRMLFHPLQVRTTAPDKYRVKPSSSSCEPGASVDIVVSLHGGNNVSSHPPLWLNE